MPQEKLTKSVVEKLPTTGERYVVRDTELPGFNVRVGRTGAKTFYLDYRPKGAGRAVSPTSLQIGRWPIVKVDDARKEALKHKAAVEFGGNPSAERREKLQAIAVEAEAITIGKLLADDGPYERSLKHRELVNWKVALSSLRRNLTQSQLMDVAPRKLTRKDLIDRYIIIKHAGKEGAATDFRKFTSGFIEWCVNNGHADHNVLSGYREPPKTRAQRVAEQENKKGRALDDREIRAIWRAAESENNPIMAGLIKVYLLTGFRRNEGARLKRSSITAAPNEKLGLSGERIEINAIEAKNGFAHAVPMTDVLRKVIAAQPKTAGGYLFPSYTTGRPMTGWTKMVKRLQEASGVNFTLHDLRRTCRTRLSKLGVDDSIAELCIGHVRPDLERRYNKNQAWDARIEAFEKYNAHIMALIGGQDGDKVIPLHAA